MADYNSSYTGAQIDEGIAAARAARAASGLLKSNGSGTITAASAGTDYVAANQGSANANKFLAVSSTGYVTLVTITSAGGVSF